MDHSKCRFFCHSIQFKHCSKLKQLVDTHTQMHTDLAPRWHTANLSAQLTRNCKAVLFCADVRLCLKNGCIWERLHAVPGHFKCHLWYNCKQFGPTLRGTVEGFFSKWVFLPCFLQQSSENCCTSSNTNTQSNTNTGISFRVEIFR